MSPTPRISVLLPAHQAAATLDPCLRSIARQSLTDWECVVVDDGSTDDTADLCRRWSLRDPRFRVVTRAHHGLVDTLNAGLAECRGRWIARMDADDLMHRERLLEQVAVLEADPGLAGVGCHVRLFPRARLTDGRRNYEDWINAMADAETVARDAFVECPVAHPTFVLHAGLLRDLGYREEGWPEDYDLFLRLHTTGHRIGVLPRRRLCWRDGPNRLSRRSSVYGLDSFVRCKAAFLATSFLGGREDYLLWGHGATGRALRKALAAHGKHPTHVVEVHPRRLGNTIRGATVIPPGHLTERPRGFLVVSVAGWGPREEIRAALARIGWRERIDFVCAA